MKLNLPAIHPGEQLADQLEALNMTPAEFARKIKVSTARVNNILRGEAPIDGEMALRLGRYFGSGPEIWLRFQNRYDLQIAEERMGKAIRKISTLKRVKEAA